MGRHSSWLLSCVLVVTSVVAQTGSRTANVPLGDGRWGTPAEAESAGLFEYRGRWLPKKLERQLKNWARLDEKSQTWEDAYDVKSKHYRIKTDVPRFIVELEIKPFLDELYATYTEVFATEFGLDSRGANQKFIRIYSSYPEYRRQTGNTRSSPGFIVGSSELYVFYEDCDPATFYHTTFHEGAHQFVAAMLPGAAFPHWLNEALATWFEGCTYSRVERRIDVGTLSPSRLHFAKKALESQPDADPQAMFMNVDKERYTPEHYALGWSFIYYLANVDGGRHRTGFGRFLRALNGSGSRPLAEVFRTATRADLAELSKGWRDFVMRLETPPAPEWVELEVGALPEGVDIREGDWVVSLAGTPIVERQQFDQLWESLHATPQTFELVLLRRSAEGGVSMDYELQEVRVSVRTDQRLQLRGGFVNTRHHNLVD